MAESKKIEYKPAYKAEFNMGLLDYNRLDEYLKRVDFYMIAIRQGNLKHLHVWYSTLRQIYSYLRSVAYEGKKADLDAAFTTIEKEIWDMKEKSGRVKSDLNFIKKLEKLQDDVYHLRQLVGMGIAVSKSYSNEERLEKALEN